MSKSASRPEPTAGKYLTAPVASTEMPKGIPYIVGNESAERFSYYGLLAILAIFLTEHLRNLSGGLAPLDENTANEWQHNFMAAVYFFPIVGAVLSDWLFGKYRMIISVSILYVAGHAVLALMDFPQFTGVDPKHLLVLGLALIAVGAGGIKPCVSAHVGDQFGEQNKHLITKAFGWFYFSVNLGATISMPLTPWLLKHYGPGWAFGVPGAAMAIAAVVFWIGRYKFVHIPPGGNAFFRETFGRDGLRAIGNLIPLYLFIIPFWCLFDQTHSAWVHQARHMNLVGFDPDVLPAQLQVVNSIFVLAFIPLFTYVVYPFLGRYLVVTPLRKIGIGLFVTALAFTIPSLIQQSIDAGGAPHIGWQILAYALMTAAEVMVSITGLEFSYTQAPRKMKSFIMGVFLLSITLGNLFTAQVNGFIVAQNKAGNAFLEGATYYWFFTAVMAVTAVAFVIWSQFYRGQTYIQGELEVDPYAGVDS
jgi:POT family proton-dependent oligopeptide transporter